MEGVQTSSGYEAAASLLRWWRDAGVDVLVEDAPRNWLRSTPLPAGERDGREATRERGRVGTQEDSPSPRLAALDIPLPGGVRVEEALPLSLPALLDWLRDSPDAPEARWGRTRILPAGDPQSGLMILTDMPGPGDAEAGILLSGEVGGLFDRMLAAIGRSRESIWLAPFASVRSIGRIAPDSLRRLVEIARHQVALVSPRRLLVMGEQVNSVMIGPDWQDRRGALQTLNFGGVKVETISTFHPQMLNDRPTYKAQAWKDLQLLMKGL